MIISENSKNDRELTDISGLSAVAILTEYAPLVKSRALKYLSNGCELDDLIQEGNIGLLFAYLRYNSGLSSFTTFARRCIDASIIDYLRKSSKISQIPDELLVDIGDVQVADSSPDPEYSLSVKDEYLKVVSKAHTVLSEMEFAVFSDLLHGYTYDEIAARHGLGLKSVNNAVQRIRVKLK